MTRYYESDLDGFADLFRRVEGERPESITLAVRAAAFAGAQALAQVAPVGVHGHFKAAMRAEPTATGAEIVNDAPYAGIIEAGARPHSISATGMESIIEWFRLKVGMTLSEATSAAWGYRAKVRVNGQRPQWVVKKRLPLLKRILAAEINRELHG